MNDMNSNNLEMTSSEVAFKKTWGKPEITELNTSLTSGIMKTTQGPENLWTSPS